jgi:hypothetical protein
MGTSIVKTLLQQVSYYSAICLSCTCQHKQKAQNVVYKPNLRFRYQCSRFGESTVRYFAQMLCVLMHSNCLSFPFFMHFVDRDGRHTE